jgi:O-antigen ligase
VIFSFSKSFNIFSYQNFKIEIFTIWAFIYIVSLNIVNVSIYQFDFKILIFLSFILFMPIIAELDESFIETWNIYSAIQRGLRGEFDIISATRISGTGILGLIVYYMLEKNRNYLLLLFFPLFIGLMIICQTRQSIVSLFFPLILLFVFDLIKTKFNIIKLLVIILSISYLINNYINYVEENNYESRLLESAESGSDIDSSGRDNIWDETLLFISKNDVAIGFGNYPNLVKSHNYPHNIFLEIIVELGWIAFFIFVIFCFLLIIELYNMFKKANAYSSIEVYFLLLTLYFLFLAQFSFDISRNLSFFYTFIMFKIINKNK